MNEIFWPQDFTPGFTDNFVSNEVIVAGLSTTDVWLFLSKAPLWPTYYSNSAKIRFDGGKGPELEGVRASTSRPSAFRWKQWFWSTWHRPKASRVVLAGMAGAVKAIHASTCTTLG